jgi:hypothetical protein
MLNLVTCKVTSSASTGLQILYKLVLHKYFLLMQIFVTPSEPYFSFSFFVISNVYRRSIHMCVWKLETSHVPHYRPVVINMSRFRRKYAAINLYCKDHRQ